jgi:hypothetical protein
MRGAFLAIHPPIHPANRPPTHPSIQPHTLCRKSIRPRTFCCKSVAACSAPVVYGAVAPKSCACPVARDLASPRDALPNRCVSAPAPGRTAGFWPWRQGELLFPPRGRRRPGDLVSPRDALPNRCVSAPAPGRTAGFRPWRQGEPLFPRRGRRRPGDSACLPRTAFGRRRARCGSEDTRGGSLTRPGEPAFRGLHGPRGRPAVFGPGRAASCCFCPRRTVTWLVTSLSQISGLGWAALPLAGDERGAVRKTRGAGA